MADDLLFEQHQDGLRLIEFNRPGAMNAITLAMAARLSTLLAEIADDPDARCIILAGAGTQSFSAGFDIKEMAGFDADQMRSAFIQRDPVVLELAEHPLPVIAAINGPAFGAGALIAAACDFRVADELASFKVTAASYGSANATWSLPRLVGTSRAKDILMTGRTVHAAEADIIGLFDRIAPAGAALEAALEFARDIVRHPKTGIANVKRLVDSSPGLSLREGWAAEHAAMLEGFAKQAVSGKNVFARFLAGK